MKKNVYILLVAAVISFSGTCSKNTGKALIGTWNFSSHVSPSQAAKLSDEPMPEGASMEMTMSGSTTYHVGSKFNEEGEFTLRIRRGAEEKALRFYVREAGTWEIHGDVLVETAVDSSITAFDDTTKEFLEAVPQIKTMLSPVKGDSTSYKLEKISDSKIILEEKEFGVTIELQRKK
jgi:hypothetical protein